MSFWISNMHFGSSPHHEDTRGEAYPGSRRCQQFQPEEEMARTEGLGEKNAQNDETNPLCRSESIT
jgi:hypothetical protein